MGVEVKGTILLDLVKQVRTEKNLGWDAYLAPEDWNIINGDVMASSWYPDDCFYRLSLAVFKVVGQSDFDLCFAYGRLAATNMIEIYKRMLVAGDPAGCIERFMTRWKSFFSTDYKDSDKNKVVEFNGGVNIHTVVDEKIRGEEVADVIAYSILGAMHELAVIAGEKNVNSNLVNKGDYYQLRVTWA